MNCQIARLLKNIKNKNFVVATHLDNNSTKSHEMFISLFCYSVDFCPIQILHDLV